MQTRSVGPVRHPCEKEISPKRLAAVPWTAYCIKCQEAADRHEFETVEAVGQFLADAA